ncbi:hypothetical protein A4A49_14958 [Nicotiana attenuata]|uniref:Uncharacterized protein n=1 Tax=Nicotiana attenuata TaxID=49451 RepID=A0A1J6I971_NICAT|nr:hypothetical protein A4A49_14958 [Nicotiana attenuata]
MNSTGYFYIIFWFLVIVVIGSESITSDSSAKNSLDSLLEQYAFRELRRPRTRTGVPYDAYVPCNLTGIKISALMLTRYSLKWRSYGYYKEFLIPYGVIEEPYARKLVLVYQNLANWSSFYYPLPGYTYLTPLLGILAYDAYDLYAKNVPELDILALKDPITIRFPYVQPAPEGSLPKCVYFYSNNLVEFRDVIDGNICETRIQGHFAIVAVVKVAPSPPPPAPSPSPTTDNIAPSPSPTTDNIAPSPFTPDKIAPSPSPTADGIAPSPPPTADGIAPSPSPTAGGIAPSSSPTAGGIAPSPSPTADDHNHQKFNSKMWTISSLSIICALSGILVVIVKKYRLLEIRERLAGVVEPLLENTEAPLPLGAPTRPLS